MSFLTNSPLQILHWFHLQRLLFYLSIIQYKWVWEGDETARNQQSWDVVVETKAILDPVELLYKPLLARKILLWRRISLWFNHRWRIWRLRMVNSHGQWDWHHTKSFRLKKLHSSSNVFFHQLSHLTFSPIVWPFLPRRLWCPSTVTSFILVREITIISFESKPTLLKSFDVFFYLPQLMMTKAYQ